MRYAFAKVACVISWETEHVILGTNDVWDANDPFVIARPDLFSDRPTFVSHTSGHEPGTLVLPPTEIRRRGGRG